MSGSLLYITTMQKINVFNHTLNNLLELVKNTKTIDFITLHLFNYIQLILKLWEDYAKNRANIFRTEITYPQEILTLQSILDIKTIDDAAVNQIFIIDNIERIISVSKEYTVSNSNIITNLDCINSILTDTNKLFVKILLKYI